MHDRGAAISPLPSTQLSPPALQLYDLSRRTLMRHLGLEHRSHHAIDYLTRLDKVRVGPVDGWLGQMLGFEEAARDLVEDLQSGLLA
jgi:hypothetical protein